MQLPKNIAANLKKLGIYSSTDLLFYFPFRHIDYSKVAKIADIEENDQVSIRGQIKQIRAVPRFGRSISRAEAVISDDTGSIKAIWFNQPYLTKYLKDGDEVVLAGMTRRYKTLQLQNPIWEKTNHDVAEKEAGETIHTGRIIPVYKLTGSLSLRGLRAAIFQTLKDTPQIPETLPAEIIADVHLPAIAETIQNIHFPADQQAFERARKRIAFEEIFYVQLAVQKHRRELQSKKAPRIKFSPQLVRDFVNALPFAMTAEQKKVTWEILQDLDSEMPMNRLLEGDVGSGKTAVALTVALETLGANKQVVLLCPTEILAQQHYNTTLKYFKNYPQISLVLLTAGKTLINNRPANKKSLLQEISVGGAQFIISTHAALQKNVRFDNIALVIIDEQHRFGVRQRAELREKRQNSHAHTLSMSATPIPRTLKLSLLGDLAVSEIRHKPPGRKNPVTKLVAPEQRLQAYEFMRKEIISGSQIFVITPLIEQNDKLGVKAANTEFENLKKIFKEFTIGLLHGKMKTVEKEEIMRQFLNNQAQILVSTSIVEVGVDVPNASVIIIEGAERFGLAQLHQFRGRVGRSDKQAYCLLFTENKNPAVIERLEKFAKTNDGFELAELDLKTRGYGNIFGAEQSGYFNFKYFSFYENGDLAELAKKWAKKLIDADPELKKYPQLARQIENKVIHNE